LFSIFLYFSYCRFEKQAVYADCITLYDNSILVVEDPTCQHILAEDGDGGRDGLGGVVVEGEVVGVDCLLLEPAIGKRKRKIENNGYKKLP
jgi:hypothetical protein